MSSLPSDEPPRLRARERGRARRRLRYLRQVRELQLRDAGGFVFELYRFGEQRDEVVRSKLDALIATDKEIRALEGLLDQKGRGRELRQPGVGGTCPDCGAFYPTDARFCAACSADLRARREEPVAEAPLAEEPVTEAPLAEQPVAEEPVAHPAPPEPEGEVTIVRHAGDEVTEPVLEASSNGAGAAEDFAQANGQLPADSELPEPDAEGVAPAEPRHTAES